MELHGSEQSEKCISPFTIDFLRRLDYQIDLILACVYSPSLQRLSDVALYCTDDNLELWLRYAEFKPETLINLLVKGLEHDRHAIQLIECFTRNSDLRDTMLRQTPHLLDGLLKAALVNERSFAKYSAILSTLCTPMLRTDVLIPSTFNSFVVALVQDCSQDGSKSLSYLERLLRTNGRTVLCGISTSQRYNMPSVLSSILGVHDTGKVIVAISCLASIAICCSTDGTLEDMNKTSAVFSIKDRKCSE